MRGKKPSIEEQIEKLRKDIETLNDRKVTAVKKFDADIKAKNEEIKDLLAEQTRLKKEELFTKLEASGKSVDDLLALLN